MKKILVPIDGSEHSDKALAKAKEIAVNMASDVTILNVISPMYDYRRRAYNKDLYREDERTTLRESNTLLHDAMKIFEDFEGNADSLYKRGDTAEIILNFTEEGDYDLVVMGSRGMGAVSRTLLGSVSDKVIHHANTSVLIVK